MSGLPIIAIDPGHNCQPDIGASHGEYSEDAIVSEVANQLHLICKNNGIKTIDCLPKSSTAVLDSLQQRIAASNDGGATIYASIHCNAASRTENQRGCETYAISTAGKAIAANINRELTKLGFKDRGVKTTLDAGVPPYVIRHTNAIAVLVEICFIDAAGDTDILDRNGLKSVAQAIFNGLTHGSQLDPQSDNHANDPVVAPIQPRSLLVDAAKWYKELPHQQSALRALEGNLTAIQLMDFKAAYSPDSIAAILPIPKSTPKSISVSVKPRMTVADWIANSDGTTSGVDGLSDRIIREMGDVGLFKFTHAQFKCGDNCDPYFHPDVAKRLRYLLDRHALPMVCNSAYRSPVRQLVLREFYERGIHGITAAARVGTGNHEAGLAIDLENWQQWRAILVDSGFNWQGMGDPMHFDLPISSGVPKLAIAAYQSIANRYGHKLLPDGVWGEKTKRSMLQAPASGW